MNFHTFLKARRKELKFSRKELCRVTGLSIDSLIAWEIGKHVPRLDLALILAEVLDFELKGFTFGKAEESRVFEFPKVSLPIGGHGRIKIKVEA